MLGAHCIDVAAHAYAVPPTAIEQVLDDAHGGVGVMGVPSSWLPILAAAGFDADRVSSDRCYNIAAGAWILALLGKSSKSEDRESLPAPRSSGIPFNLVACVRDAADEYRLPLVLFRAVLLTEGGQVGKISQNANGSYDMGPAQINSSHLPELAAMGINRDQVINDGCLNIHIGAWILAGELGDQTPANAADFWRRIGNYNSRTPEFNWIYQWKVWKNVGIAADSQTLGP
jgi:hypothetical protein